MVDLKKFFNNRGFEPAVWTGMFGSGDAYAEPTTPYTANDLLAASAHNTDTRADPVAPHTAIYPWAALPATIAPPSVPAMPILPQPPVTTTYGETVVTKGGAGRPRKYDFGPVDDETYRRLARKETLRLANVKRKEESVIIIPKDLSSARLTPMPSSGEPDLSAAYSQYITLQMAMQARIEEFQEWLSEETQRVADARTTYIGLAGRYMLNHG